MSSEEISKILEQNKRIIEQNRKLQEQLSNISSYIQSLEKKIEYANAISIVNNRSVSMLSSVGSIFSEEDHESALSYLQSRKQEEDASIASLIELGRTKYE